MPGTSCNQNGSPLHNPEIEQKIQSLFYLSVEWWAYMITVSYPPITPFTLNEGSYPKTSVESLSLDFLDELHQIISSIEIILRV